MLINIIAAIGKNRELGKDNKLLWYIPNDFKRFKDLTSGHIVIMGRKTFESIGKPLPNRINVVVTRNKNAIKGLINQTTTIFCDSLENALRLPFDKLRVAQGKRSKKIFIIGGAEIYKQGIKYADKLYLTLVNQEFPDADTFFPDYSKFKIIKEEKYRDEKYSFKFVELIK